MIDPTPEGVEEKALIQLENKHGEFVDMRQSQGPMQSRREPNSPKSPGTAKAGKLLRWLGKLGWTKHRSESSSDIETGDEPVSPTSDSAAFTQQSEMVRTAASPEASKCS